MTPVIVHDKTIKIVCSDPRNLRIFLDKNNILVFFRQLPGHMRPDHSGANNYYLHDITLIIALVLRKKQEHPTGGQGRSIFSVRIFCGGTAKNRAIRSNLLAGQKDFRSYPLRPAATV
jgi:hypothetical protein